MDNESAADITQVPLEKMSPEAKKTILEWAKYLGKALLAAIFSKVSSDFLAKDESAE